MIKAPVITINGNKYTAKAPKMKVWREAMALANSTPDDDFMGRYAQFFADVFADPAVTPEAVMDNIDISAVMPLYLEITKWVVALVGSKMAQIPNAESPAKQG